MWRPLLGHHSEYPVRIATNRYASETDWSSVNVSTASSHLVAQTLLSNHVRLLTPVNLVCSETDRSAGKGAQFTVSAMDSLEGVLLTNLTVNHPDVESHWNPRTLT